VQRKKTETKSAAEPYWGPLYLAIGSVIGYLLGAVTFVGAWWYCAATYGFLFGFGLGWLPAAILAVIVTYAAMFLWGPAVIVCLWLLASIQH
jgi:hypothetical protein